MSETAGRRGLTLALATVTGIAPSFAAACSIAHDAARSTDKVVAVNVRMKSGERCVIRGDKAQPWFPVGEKMSFDKGPHGRLVYELHGRNDPGRARWQYVYVSPRGWSGQDRVSLFYAMPPVEIRYDIVVAP